jgi:hypothetical protein
MLAFWMPLPLAISLILVAKYPFLKKIDGYGFYGGFHVGHVAAAPDVSNIHRLENQSRRFYRPVVRFSIFYLICPDDVKRALKPS